MSLTLQDLVSIAITNAYYNGFSLFETMNDHEIARDMINRDHRIEDSSFEDILGCVKQERESHKNLGCESDKDLKCQSLKKRCQRLEYLVSYWRWRALPFWERWITKEPKEGVEKAKVKE